MSFLILLARVIGSFAHIALVLAAAPAVIGLVGVLRARLLGRRGPAIWQPYARLRRLLRKDVLTPETATDLFPLWPYVCMAAMVTAAALVPGFCTGLVTAPLSDVITLAGLLALARAATLLAGLETGFGFGGAGAARDLLFSVFVEASLLVLLLTFGLIAHTQTVDGIAEALRASHIGISVSLGFALAAMLAIALTETGRIPADNPAGHLELAMVHEAMLLEYSGGLLALFEYAAMLRLIVWMDLIGTIFLPFGIARAQDVLSWPGGLALWAGKLLVMAVVLCLFEVSTAKMRVFRVPEFLGVAMLLGVLSSVFLFVAARIGG